MPSDPPFSIRHLVVVFGDQLNLDAAVFDGFESDRDAIWMAEADSESTQVWSHQQRIVLFLAAMRHYRDCQRQAGRTVLYRALEEAEGLGLLDGLAADLVRLKPDRVRVVRPGEHRIRSGLEQTCQRAGVPLEELEDRHFLSTPAEFAAHAEGRKELRMEYFYREMRRSTGVLMEEGQPCGGQWNFDKENRSSFGKKGPQAVPEPVSWAPDQITKEVMDLVARRFADHPGSLASFRWPVTHAQAREALEDFVQHRLAGFGLHQDAMWTDQPFLWHSLISSALNLKLLDPRDAIKSAEQAYRDGVAPLPAVEGFVRQILGWREYVRGVYWHYMPEYLDRNALGADQALPAFFWTGETELECLRQTIGQTLEHGYAHHIQRLMVTGLYALLLGVDPQQVHEWYLAVYVDAVEWVELPNSLGMSQYADGGVMASKPYVATGKYIQRMSNYCQRCPKNPSQSVGGDACPFTTLYWDFLLRHREKLSGNRRMGLQLRNLNRLSVEEMEAIQTQAGQWRDLPATASNNASA